MSEFENSNTGKVDAFISRGIEFTRFLASPTLLIAHGGKRVFNKAIFLKCWSLGFWILSALILIKQEVSPTRFPVDGLGIIQWCWINLINGNVVPALLLCVPLSRCNEISSAFLRDAFEKLPDRRGDFRKAKSDEISMKQRVDHALVSFSELAMNFAILYTLLPKESWASSNIARPLEVVDALYYSVVTITTLGYGDLTPMSSFAKFLSVYEVLSGVVMLVVCLAVYMLYAGQKKEEQARR